MDSDSNTHATRRVCIRLTSVSACSTQCSLHGFISPDPLTEKAPKRSRYLLQYPSLLRLRVENPSGSGSDQRGTGFAGSRAL